LEKLALTHSSAQYTGNYVFIGNSAGTDASQNLVSGCTFDGGANNTLGAWIKFDKAIINQVRDCSFWNGQYAISMQTAAGSYTNVLTIDCCSFAQYRTSAIYGGGQSVTVSNNTFEQSSSGTQSAYSTVSTSFGVMGFNWTGNWFGDGTTTSSSMVAPYGSAGFNFSGNFVNGFANTAPMTAIDLSATDGFSITGNQFYTCFNAIYYSSASNGGIVMGNNFHSVTNIEQNTANKGAQVTTGNNSTV
jgi:hypothetical protein